MILGFDGRAKVSSVLQAELFTRLRPTQGRAGAQVMTQKTYRGGEGRNTAPHGPERGSPDLPEPPKRATQQGITRTERGEEQPTDKSRAQQVHQGGGESAASRRL